MRHRETTVDTLKAYSCAQAADLLGVHRQTIHRWVSDGRLAAFDIGAPGGRPRLRITGEDLRNFIEARRVNGGSAA